MIVSLDNLASTILGAATGRGADENAEDDAADVSGPATGSRDHRSSRSSRVECIFVDHDQYISNTKDISRSDTPHYKSYLKGMKSVKLSAESYLSSLQDPSSQAAVGLEGVPVFAVTDLSFFVLRDFGTALMRRERMEKSSSGACDEMIEKYPKHRRVLKTLSVAIDNYLRQHNIWSNSGTNGSERNRSGSHASASSSLITVLLYSKIDDRFDMITLNCSKGRGGGHASVKRR